MVKYVLSIDGGGTKIIAGLEILYCIEKELDINISKKFDLIAGVSAGSLLGTAISYYKLPIKTIRNDFLTEDKLYNCLHEALVAKKKSSNISKKKRLKNKLYSILDKERIIFDTKFDDDVFIKNFSRFIPEGPFNIRNKRDPEHETIKNLILTYNISKGEANLWRNWSLPDKNAKNNGHASIKDICLASTSAIPYFKPKKIVYNSLYNLKWQDDYHIDGTFLTPNPSFYAWMESKILWKNEDIKVLSIGNGQKDCKLNVRNFDDWGLYKWSTKGKLDSIIMDGAYIRESNQMNYLLGNNYLRLNGKHNISFDDYSTESNKLLKDFGKTIFDQNKYSLIQFFGL